MRRCDDAKDCNSSPVCRGTAAHIVSLHKNTFFLPTKYKSEPVLQVLVAKNDGTPTSQQSEI